MSSSGISGSRTSMAMTVPISGSARTVRVAMSPGRAVARLRTRQTQGGLHRLRVAVTGEGGAADHVDLGTLSFEDLIVEQWHGDRTDIRRLWPIGRILERDDVGDPAPGNDELDLHVAVEIGEVLPRERAVLEAAGGRGGGGGSAPGRRRSGWGRGRRRRRLR